MTFDASGELQLRVRLHSLASQHTCTSSSQARRLLELSCFVDCRQDSLVSLLLPCVFAATRSQPKLGLNSKLVQVVGGGGGRELCANSLPTSRQSAKWGWRGAATGRRADMLRRRVRGAACRAADAPRADARGPNQRGTGRVFAAQRGTLCALNTRHVPVCFRYTPRAAHRPGRCAAQRRRRANKSAQL